MKEPKEPNLSIGLKDLRLIAPGAYDFFAGEAPQLQLVRSLPAVPPARKERKGLFHYLCFYYTLWLLGVNLVEFFTGRSVPGSTLSSVYFAVLSAYAGDKELGLWHRAKEDPAEAEKKKGEWFVFVWVIFAAIAATAAAWLPGFRFPGVAKPIQLHEPHELAAITLEVIAVFFGTKASKHFRDRRFGSGSASLAVQIIEILRTNAALTRSEIVERTGGHPQAVWRELAKLIAQGKVVKIAEGPRDPDTRYKLADGVGFQ